jgi:hypothetical protein
MFQDFVLFQEYVKRNPDRLININKANIILMATLLNKENIERAKQRITPHDVSYLLEVPPEEANSLLKELYDEKLVVKNDDGTFRLNKATL